MNGAMAELLASTSKAPTSTSVITIGASQYFLFSLMNCQSSLTTCAFDIATPSKHLFVVTRIALAFRIRFPIGRLATAAPIERIPARQSFHYTDGRYHQEEDYT